MMIQANVTGLPLHKAETFLSESGISWRTEEIFPRGRTDVGDGILRVIKTSESQDGLLVLTVCRVPMPEFFGTDPCSER